MSQRAPWFVFEFARTHGNSPMSWQLTVGRYRLALSFEDVLRHRRAAVEDIARCDRFLGRHGERAA